MRLRRMLAVWAAKLTEKISVHIFHRQGVTWAGKIALQICPSILKELAGQVKKDMYIVKPDYMVLTNLFRDQLDRYGEIDITMNILKEVMQSAPKMKVIVNGDDALSAYLAMESGNEFITYGISEKVIDDKDSREIREGRFCKQCGEPLMYHIHSLPAGCNDKSDT